MSIATAIRELFKKSPKTGEEYEEGETAFSTPSLLYTGFMSQYNPDDLIGRKGFGIYKKMMQDEQVKAVVRFHRDAVTGRAWTFTDCSELSDEENAVRKRILTEAVKKIPGSLKTRLDMIMSSLYTGFSLVEKTFDIIEVDGTPWMGIKSLTKKPFETFYFNLNEYGQLESLEQEVEARRQKLDIKNFIHHVCNPDIHEWYGQSELREAYRAWWSKDVTIALQNIYLERAAAGFTWARPAQNTTLTTRSKEYNDIKSVLMSLRNQTAALFPSNIDVTVEKPSDTQAFDRAIQSHDKAIAKALLMPNLLGLSEQGPNGSRALGDTQLEAFLWMLDAEATQLEEIINEQLFADLARLNWADGLFPRWSLKELSNKQFMEIVDKWIQLTGSKVVRKTSTDEDHIRASLGFPEFDEEKELKPEPAPPLPGQQPSSDPAGADDEDDDKNEDDKTDKKVDAEEQTIVGAGSATVTAQMARNKALSRVDFKVIDRNASSIEADNVSALSLVITDAVTNMLTPVLEQDAVSPETVDKLNFDSRGKSRIQKALKSMLASGWSIGLKHAKAELGKAAKTSMSIDFVRLDESAADFFSAKSFSMTGKLTSDMLSTAENVLLQSIKNQSSTRDTVDEIYRKFVSSGFISAEDAEAQMAGVLGTSTTVSTTARLNTIVRTNTFEALNEARYSYFTDPALGGFVKALEYSSILDSRTTAICEHLDGHVHAADGDVWNDGYRPPNHFNCRSLLIAITEFDEWTESEYPELSPQEGFQ